MALTPVPPIEPVLPDPPNPLDDETTFDAAAYAWSAALPGFGSDLEAIGSATYANALEAVASATTAATQVNLATTQATNAANSAIAAANSTASNGVLWVSGTTYTVGTLVYSPATLLTYRRRVSGAGTIDPSADSTNWASQTPSTLLNKTYLLRSDLRSLTPANGDAALVDKLGLFVWASGSTEPDDDKTCFATASGAWLLEAPHWDVIDSFIEPETDATLTATANSRILTGSTTCTITSVGATASASFTGTVTGAAIGDRVVATPPGQLGSDSANTSRLSYHAWVSAANTVTVMLANASAGNATTNAVIQAAWPVSVIKA